MIKKILWCVVFAFLMSFTASAARVSSDCHPEGVYTSCNSKNIDDDLDLKYTFTSDSLYVDVADTGCGLTSYQLIYSESNPNKCIALETIYNPDNGQEYVFIHKAEFTPLNDDCSEILISWEMRTNEDKIKRIKERIRRK